MKSETEIIKAHDRLVALLLDEVPAKIDEDTKIAIRSSADVLCWILDHDHNQTFAANLAKLDRDLAEHGYVFMESPSPNV